MNHLANIRPKLWNNEEVKALIHFYKIHKEDFANHTLKVGDVWELISQKLHEQGIKKSAVDCDKKFRNLKVAFKKVYYDMERTTESKYQWEFYEDLLEVMVTDRQLRRAVPVTPVAKINEKTNQVEGEPRVTHIYTLEPDSENLHQVSYENDTENISQAIFVEIEPPSTKRMRFNEKEEEENFVETNATLDEEISPDPSSSVDLVDPSNENVQNTNESHITHDDESHEPPLWFQNSFLMKYETSIKLMHDTITKIFERQELQSTMLEHISNRLARIERRLTLADTQKTYRNEIKKE